MRYSLSTLFLLILVVAALLGAWRVGQFASAILIAAWIPCGILTFLSVAHVRSRWLRLFVGPFVGGACGTLLAALDRAVVGPDPLYPSGLLSHIGFGAVIGFACAVVSIRRGVTKV